MLRRLRQNRENNRRNTIFSSGFWEFLKIFLKSFFKNSSNRIAGFTGYVHLAVYLSVFAFFKFFFSLAFTIVLGILVNTAIGIVFWLLPTLLVRYKNGKGKNWNALLTILNLALVRYLVYPIWSLLLFFFFVSCIFKFAAWVEDSPEKNPTETVRDFSSPKAPVSAYGKVKLKKSKLTEKSALDLEALGIPAEKWFKIQTERRLWKERNKRRYGSK